MEVNIAYNEDCIEGLKRIKDESVDVILTDPPYLYLKNQKLDRWFDENLFFEHVKRILKNNGFIVLFGRGTSFYRWNTILSNLGFVFKEEIIWNKRYTSSPVTPISRKHETISIHSKGNSSINKVKIPYIEEKQFDLYALENDIKRLKSALNNDSSFDKLIEFLNGADCYTEVYRNKNNVTISDGSTMQRDRCINTMQSIKNGANESSIITIKRDNYTAYHPTQKPIRLVERLLALVSNTNDLIVDPFAGSFVVGKACINMGLNYILYEIDEEYYNNGKESLENHIKDFKLKNSQKQIF